MFKITESSVTIRVNQGEDLNADYTRAAGLGEQKASFN